MNLTLSKKTANCDPARRWANVAVILGKRRRQRWPNIKTTLVQRFGIM